jgi:hypothetical protein
MDLGEVGWGDVDWIGLAKDRNRWRAVVNSVLNLRVPWDGFANSATLCCHAYTIICIETDVKLSWMT